MYYIIINRRKILIFHDHCWASIGNYYSLDYFVWTNPNPYVTQRLMSLLRRLESICGICFWLKYCTINIAVMGCSHITFQIEKLKLKYDANIYWIKQVPRTKALWHSVFSSSLILLYFKVYLFLLCLCGIIISYYNIILSS